MKIIFAGTPEIAARVLDSLLLQKEHEIVAVLTQADRPSGRGQKLTMSPVKIRALHAGVPVYQPLKLTQPEIHAVLQKYQADLMIVVAYGLIIPTSILVLPRWGCWNIHVSLLPRWRGASPIQRAIEAEDPETGVTLMQMDAGLDTGPILLQKKIRLHKTLTSKDLHDLLAEKSIQILEEGFELQQAGLLHAKPQSEEGVSYAYKIKKTEAQLDWTMPATKLAAKIRALSTWPVCFSQYQDKIIKIGNAEVAGSEPSITEIQPGRIAYIHSNGVGVETGCGILEILSLQLPAGKMLATAIFLNGRRNFFIESEFFR